MLTFEGEPEFLRKFRVAGYQVSQAFGDIGTLFVSLHPLKYRSEMELETHADLQKMLGEELTCGVGDWKFVGTVEAVETATQANVFQLTVRDPLAKLDKIFASQMFTDETLGGIASELMPPKVDYQFLGGCDSFKFRMAVQYEESIFDFLKRLMQEVGGQIWCSGGVVYLGTAPSDESVTLRLGRDISEFSIRTGLGPETVAVDSIDYVDKNTILRSEVEMASKNWGDIQDAAIKLRKDKEEKSAFHIVHEDAGYEDTDHLAQRFLRAQASGRFFLTGIIKSPVPLGSKLSIENFQPANQEKGISEKSLVEETIVTRYVGIGDPSGTEDRWEIEAENPESMLDLDDHVPDRMVTSTAIVEDADDPMKMNRVRVYFPWDATQNSSAWLRVATPSWGADHAHYIPPEPGDTVLVTWGLRDVDPVVLASVPAGDELDLSGEVMVLKTVEGHTVTVGKNNIKILNEAEGGATELEILPDQLVVKTKNGQEVTIGSDSLKLDSGSGSSIEVQSSKIVITAAEVEISTTGGGAVKISGPTVSINNGALEVV